MTEQKTKATVFIVDDDKFLIDMYSLKFSREGFDVAVAMSGEDALSKLREGLKPQAILVDVIMPAMDGLDFVEKAKTEKLLEVTKIIMLTNQSGEAEIERAKKLKVDGYIVKATTVPSEVVSEVKKIAGI
jgi:CheY-like chemotaxis protein